MRSLAWCLIAVLGLPLIHCQSRLVPDLERQQLRRERRAYDGAPPLIPHAVRALGRHDCLECHEKGLDLKENGLASSTPHPRYLNCQQCHLEQRAGLEPPTRNSFQGARHPLRGNRPYAQAPPTVPHPVAMRKNCLGCHGALGGSPIRTPHADRVNCRQCHLTRPARSADVTHPWKEGNGNL